jgi:hypothetical protein
MSNELKELKEELTAVEQTIPTEPEVLIMGQIIITAYSNGNINLQFAEGSPEIKPKEIELLVRNVYDQLYENRITQQALDLFKSKL